MATVQTGPGHAHHRGQSRHRAEGTLILDAAKALNIRHPDLLLAPGRWHPLPSAEVPGRGREVRNLQPACAVYVAEGMVV